MGRRRPTETDSLELMLDTICNTFGGIVFLALLICLISRNVVKDQRSKSEYDDQRLEAAQVVSKLTELEAEGALVAQSMERQQALLQSFAGQGRSADDTQQLLQQIGQLQNQIASIEKLISDKTNAASKATTEATRLTAAADQLLRDLADKTAAIAEKSKQQELKMRTPLARTTFKRQVPLLLANGGRVYQPIAYGDGGFANGHTRGFDVAMADDELTIRELKDCPGIDAAAAAELAGWRRTLNAALASDRHYLCFAVWPDSYDAFIQIRDAFVQDGFEYQLLIMGKDETISFGDSGPGQVQ